MKDSSKRLMSLLASLLLVAGSFFLFVTLIEPAYDTVNGLRGTVASRTATYAEQQEVVAEASALFERYESVTVLREAIARAIPHEAEYATLVNQLGSIARISNLILESVEPHAVPSRGASPRASSARTLPAPEVIQINLRLAGTYESFKAFLERIETNIRVMDLVRLSIVPGKSGTTYSYDVVVHTYYQSL